MILMSSFNNLEIKYYVLDRCKQVDRSNLLHVVSAVNKKSFCAVGSSRGDQIEEMNSNQSLRLRDFMTTFAVDKFTTYRYMVIFSLHAN